MTATSRFLGGVAAAALVVAGGTATSSAQQQMADTVPISGVVSTYKPAGKRISPQDGMARQLRSNAPTPRDAEGHPDLTGQWGANFPSPLGTPGLLAVGRFEPDQAVMQRGAQWNKPLYKPEFWEKVRSLDFSKADVDPAYGCSNPVGVPRQNVPGRIIQKDKMIWMLHNVENGIRILPIDGRKRDEQDYQYSFFNGQGLARWEGDVLVIDSVGFTDQSWLGWEGYFHTDRMEVTERFLRQGDLLFYNFTVNDPDVLLEPWTSITYVRRLNPNLTRQDEALPCEERDMQHLADPYMRG